MKSHELFVIAGPNGAGKSTLSAALVRPGTFVFDGDKELQILQKRFPGIDSAILFDSVNGVIFEEKKSAAIAKYLDFALETNFASAKLMDTVRQFKAHGYQISLIFIGLPSTKQAVERVAMRVEKGGHNVSVENIKSNFTNGLRNFARYFRQFDNAAIFYNKITKNKSPQIISFISFNKGKVLKQANALPEWVKKLVMEKSIQPEITPTTQAQRRKR